ncbi:hypothetical protein [Falsibacillus pallidus]|uniref:Uncharacterized protein n=1 Tax=Falsibacillus pallidus TaxID=493781 RepID=A0A370G346_9BACI|nr:hypothetical protein [Falsibacillus pallidus]RDI36473.1 hypothetical protein DFR59_1298 [Falsibacillus pallidus]
MEGKCTVKTRLAVDKFHQLNHEIIILRYPKSHLRLVGPSYIMQLTRESQKGSISIRLSFSQALLIKNEFRISDHTLIKQKSDNLEVHVKKIISHKRIKRVKNEFSLSYKQGSDLEVTYSIPEQLFMDKYQQAITRMVKNHKTVSTAHKQHTQTNKPLLTNNNSISGNPSKKKQNNNVRAARYESFRRCSNCDYFINKLNQCGLFSRTVSIDNVCSRFNYTKYRTYLGGGFSPR